MTDINNKLLEKYWKGETTLEEEKIIKQHFASNDTPDDNLSSMFSFFDKEKQITYNKNIEFPETKVFKINFYRELAVAASIVLLLGLAFLIRKNIEKPSQNQLAKYEIKDSEKAKEITKNALAMLAKNYNKGETVLSKNIKNINKIDIINSFIKNN
jgi:hypothetical protein